MTLKVGDIVRLNSEAKGDEYYTLHNIFPGDIAVVITAATRLHTHEVRVKFFKRVDKPNTGDCFCAYPKELTIVRRAKP